MKVGKKIIIYIIICLLSAFCVQKIFLLHKERENVAISYFALLPESVAKIVSVEFPGLISDYLMLNTLTFMGEKFLSQNHVSPEEWQMIYQALKLVINLDPRGTDAFTLAETTLPWEADMIEETNELLLRVAQVQTNNYRPYFFLWFNHFYFLNDPKKAAFYLQKSAKIPGAPTYYATLAARMQLLAGQHAEGIFFLQEMIRETTDIKRIEYLNRRLQALTILAFLEKNKNIYIQKFKKRPEILQDLVTEGIITAIPKDPYNGKFYLLENGRVYTTSQLVSTSEKSEK